jgi:hypothetical protein
MQKQLLSNTKNAHLPKTHITNAFTLAQIKGMHTSQGTQITYSLKSKEWTPPNALTSLMPWQWHKFKECTPPKALTSLMPSHPLKWRIFVIPCSSLIQVTQFPDDSLQILHFHWWGCFSSGTTWRATHNLNSLLSKPKYSLNKNCGIMLFISYPLPTCHLTTLPNTLTNTQLLSTIAPLLFFVLFFTTQCPQQLICDDV